MWVVHIPNISRNKRAGAWTVVNLFTYLTLVEADQLTCPHSDFIGGWYTRWLHGFLPSFHTVVNLFVRQLIKFLTFRSVHFHAGRCARPSFSIFRGSGSETRLEVPKYFLKHVSYIHEHACIVYQTWPSLTLQGGERWSGLIDSCVCYHWHGTYSVQCVSGIVYGLCVYSGILAVASVTVLVCFLCTDSRGLLLVWMDSA